MQGAGGSAGLGRFGGYFVALLVALATWYGWRTFWFLTDDAFIAFRYAANFVAGRGLVWNPWPFVPVEGYTSFSWTFGLALLWKLTGITPPEAANWISLACGLVTLWLCARLVLEMALAPSMERLRWPLLLLVLLATLTNRTFLAWLSSGLETALVNLLITWWLRAALRRQAWQLTSAAALLALTRPDGLLFVAATPVVLLLERRERFPFRTLLPLLVVPLQLAFRLHTYGEWVPNTYFAKHVAAWPESGLRYAASFMLEYGVWLWLLLLVAFCVQLVRSHSLTRERLFAHAPAIVSIGTLLAQAGYYTLIIGGDHFEYRVYSQLVPLLFVSAAFMAAHSFARPLVVAGSVLAFMLVSWPIPWVHWYLTRELNDRDHAFKLVMPVASYFPGPLAPVAETWDELQAWLIPHFVCIRHQEHKVFWQMRAGMTPPRSVGAQIGWQDRPVMAAQSVGVFAWRLPNVAIIDRLGLNDRIIAHTPLPPGKERKMAHDRVAPPGYVECFKPSVWWERDTGIRVGKRSAPLTDAEIIACERRFAAQVGLDVSLVRAPASLDR
jgi:arabinofuranosyltransferase